MEINCNENPVIVSCRNGRINVYCNGESYSAPGSVKFEKDKESVGKIFTDWNRMRRRTWSAHSFLIGPFKFGLYKDGINRYSLEVEQDGCTLFSEYCSPED